MNSIRNGGWLAAAALGALLPVQAAMGADLPVKAKPIVAATFDWSGVYAGVHAGYGGGATDWAQGGGIAEADFITRGALAGGQVGINKQLGSLVIGAEFSGSWAHINGSSHRTVGGPALGVLVDVDHASGIDSLATFAARAGLAADRWFVFAKAGLTAAHEKHSGSLVQSLPAPAGARFISGNEVRYAPMLGFGTEYALTGNWSLFGEYNFHYLGERGVALQGTTTFGGFTSAFNSNERIDQSIHVAKVGVNYRWRGVAIDPSFAQVPPAPGNNWTGGYVGVQGGYAWGNTQWPDTGGVSPSPRTDGWLAGGSIGANAQAGSLVFGVEGEILGTGIVGNSLDTVPVFGGGTATLAFSSKIDWLALATARAGFVAGSNLMLYGKGGVAIAEESHTINIAQTLPVGAVSASTKAIHTGMVAGAGIEYAIAPNWSIKSEYDYVKMFQQKLVASGVATGGGFGAGGQFVVPIDKVGQDLHLVKFGVNYHFNPVPAMAAKY